MRSPPALLFLAALLLGAIAVLPTRAQSQTTSSPNASSSKDLFTGPILHVKVDIPEASYNELRRVRGFGGPKVSVPAAVSIGDERFEKVSVQLKGSAGSFRPIDANPGLTLNFSKLKPGRTFRGHSKLHLNNSVQDGSRISEYLASQLFLKAGVPAARVTHARVTLNGRELGHYLLKEGYDKQFLERHFGDATGNLYDGGFVQDIDQELERDSGTGPDDHSDLRQLFEAAMERDFAQRQKLLSRHLDLDRLVSVAALQILTDDWDGYLRNRNNYRLYHSPRSGQFVLIPHGMDQLFRQPTSSLRPPFNSILGRKVFELPEFKAKLQQRIREFTNTVFTAASISNLLTATERRLIAAIADPDERQFVVANMAEIHERIEVRLNTIATAGSRPPASIQWGPEGFLPLTEWRPRNRYGGKHEIEEKDGKPAEMKITATQAGTEASYRTRKLLPAGLYVFSCRAKAIGIHPARGQQGAGAGLRVSGFARSEMFSGTTEWQTLRFEFELEDEYETEFVAELCAHRGAVIFDAASFRLEPQKP